MWMLDCWYIYHLIPTLDSKQKKNSTSDIYICKYLSESI